MASTTGEPSSSAARPERGQAWPSTAPGRRQARGLTSRAARRATATRPRPASAGGRAGTETSGDGVVRGLEEVADQKRQHPVDVIGVHLAGQRPGSQHGVDVEAVAARADQHEEGVEPGRTEGGQFQSQNRPRRRGGSAGCRRGRRCARASRRRRLREPRREGGRLLDLAAGRSGGRTRCQYAGQMRSRRRWRQVELGRRQRQLGATPRARPGRRRARPAATGGGARAPRRTRCRAPPSRRRAATAAGARVLRLGSPGACGPPRGRRRRTASGPSPRPPSRSAAAVGAGEHRGEAGREAAALGGRDDHGRPAPILDEACGRHGGRCGQVSRCAARPRGIVVGMAVTRGSSPKGGRFFSPDFETACARPLRARAQASSISRFISTGSQAHRSSARSVGVPAQGGCCR